MSWLDIDEAEDSPVAIHIATPDAPADPVERIRVFDAAWAKLKVEQKSFLVYWKAARFQKQRAYRAMEAKGIQPPDDSTEYRWGKNENYAFVKKILKHDAVEDILERERLIMRQDDCAELLLAPKPILYQGEHTGFYENEPAAAAKVNETLLRVGGHLRDEQAAAPTSGPALIVQVTNKIGGEVESSVTIGVVPEQAAPVWLDA